MSKEKKYLYVLAGSKNFKRTLMENNIRVSEIDLLMIEKGSPEEESIKDNLKEIFDFKRSYKETNE